MEISTSNGSSEADGSIGIKVKFAQNESHHGRRCVSQDCSPDLSEAKTLSSDGMIVKTQLCELKNSGAKEKVTQIWAKKSKPEKIIGDESKQRTEDWARSTINPKHVPQTKKIRNKISLLDQESESYSETMESDIISFQKHVGAIGIPAMGKDEIQKMHQFYLQMKSRGKTVEESHPVTRSRYENYPRSHSIDKSRKLRKHKRSVNHDTVARSKSAQKKNMDNRQLTANPNVNANTSNLRSTSTFNLPSISQAQFQEKLYHTHPNQWANGQTYRTNRRNMEDKPVSRIDYATLKISNLPASTRYADLEVLFPEAISMTLPTREIIDWENNEVNLFAYILFATVQEARNIKKKVAGRRFRGHDLIIEYRQTY